MRCVHGLDLWRRCNLELLFIWGMQIMRSMHDSEGRKSNLEHLVSGVFGVCEFWWGRDCAWSILYRGNAGYAGYACFGKHGHNLEHFVSEE